MIEPVLCIPITALEFRKRIEADGKIEACRFIRSDCEVEEQADAIIRSYVASLMRVRKLAAAGVVLLGERLFNPRPESVKTVWRALEHNAKVLIQGGSSVGKCLAKGTEVLMFDGSISKVEDIEDGDLVMGDDSTPRRVKSLARGRSKMFEVTPKKGEPWVCNEHHVLTLKCSNDKKNGDGKTTSSTYTKGKVIDIPVRDFAEKSKTFKTRFKQFNVPVKFPNQAVEFDPYIYGLWLGDGGTNHPVLHNADPILIDEWCGYFRRLGYSIYVGGENDGPCRAYYCRNGSNKKHPFKDFVKGSTHGGQKIIRKEFLNNSRDVRMELLAGIIDTDGTAAGCGYSVISKFPKLARGIQYLARSLGFFSSFKTKMKEIKDIGFKGYYYEIYIGGSGCSEIPTRLKECSPVSNRDGSCTSIEVRELPEAEYFGFETDGNHRFLLGDFTVTHNSYTGICWTLFDWWADPENTTVKLISTTGGHAKANTFGTMAMLYRSTIIKMPGILNAESLSYSEDDKRASISIVRIKEGEDNSGVLQGFHPLPRAISHPIYGDSTRVRAVLDEAEEIALGVWKGCDNMLGSRSGKHSVKVFGFYNPKDISARTAQLAEPQGGWGEFDLEKGVKGKNEWTSRRDWKVIRIDPARTENVIARKEIFTGLQTWEGYNDYLKEQNGNSLSYYTFGRGAYPPDGAISVVFTQRVLNAMRGEFVWSSATIKAGGGDVAIDGRDKAVMAVGRTGKASGFISYQFKEDGTYTKTLLRFREDRECIQLDQLFPIAKGAPKIVGDGMKLNALKAQIAPEWYMLDRTGNGGSVHDYLMIPEVWSPQVRAIDFSQNPTEVKVLEQDQLTPLESYEGIHSEVWFAAAKLAEHGCLAIAPSVRAEELERELIGRRYKLGAGKKLVVEKKDEYKKRLGNSPDHADAFTIFVHCARTGGNVQGSMTGLSSKNKPQDHDGFRDPIENPDWIYETEQI